MQSVRLYAASIQAHLLPDVSHICCLFPSGDFENRTVFPDAKNQYHFIFYREFFYN